MWIYYEDRYINHFCIVKVGSKIENYVFKFLKMKENEKEKKIGYPILSISKRYSTERSMKIFLFLQLKISVLLSLIF